MVGIFVGISKRFTKFIKPVYAHCDLPCGVYDPAQARIEAESVLKIMEKYEGLEQENKWRAVFIKEQRADLVKQHLWVLWTDYFKPEHVEAHPELHDLLWRTTKQAGACKKSTDPAEGQKLLDMIGQVAEIFAATKKAS
jgi:nickel superoxide dismutase